MKVLSAGLDGMAREDDGAICFAPVTCQIEDVQLAVERASTWAKNNPGHKPVAVDYFHPSDFKEENPNRGKFSFVEFENILKWLAGRSGVQIKFIGDIDEFQGHGTMDYIRYSRLRRWLGIN